MRLGDFDLRLSSDINTALLVTRDVGNLLVNCCFFGISVPSYGRAWDVRRDDVQCVSQPAAWSYK